MRSKILNKNINKKILFNIEWEPYMNYFDVIKYQKKLKKIEEKRRQKRLEYLKNKKSLSLYKPKTKSRDRRPKERRNSVQPKDRRPKERKNSVQPKDIKDIPKSKESVKPKSRELKQKRITSYYKPPKNVPKSKASPKNVPKSKASPKNVPKSNVQKQKITSYFPKISKSKASQYSKEIYFPSSPLPLPSHVRDSQVFNKTIGKYQSGWDQYILDRDQYKLNTITEEIPEKKFSRSVNVFNNTDF